MQVVVIFHLLIFYIYFTASENGYVTGYQHDKNIVKCSNICIKVKSTFHLYDLPYDKINTSIVLHVNVLKSIASVAFVWIFVKSVYVADINSRFYTFWMN